MNRLCLIFFILILLSSLRSYAIMQDSYFVTKLSGTNLQPETVITNYNYQSTNAVPIKLAILQPIKSEKDIYEGQWLTFKAVENSYYRYKAIVKKGTVCTARVETIITNGMNGIPSSVILGDFNIKGLDKNKMISSYEKYGIDLSLLVFPIKWALTPFPPTGSLTNFIKGGHVKIKTNDIITIYYYPEIW